MRSAELKPGDRVVITAGLSKGAIGIIRDVAKIRWRSRHSGRLPGDRRGAVVKLIREASDS